MASCTMTSVPEKMFTVAGTPQTVTEATPVPFVKIIVVESPEIVTIVPKTPELGITDLIPCA